MLRPLVARDLCTLRPATRGLRPHFPTPPEHPTPSTRTPRPSSPLTLVCLLPIPVHIPDVFLGSLGTVLRTRRTRPEVPTPFGSPPRLQLDRAIRLDQSQATEPPTRKQIEHFGVFSFQGRRACSSSTVHISKEKSMHSNIPRTLLTETL